MPNSQPEIRWMKPKQARSQETLDRILIATEQLLEAKHFEELTILEIVDRAQCSVGAFYARFRDKQALFECIQNRYFDEQQATSMEHFEPSRWHGVSLRERIEAFVRFAIHFNRENTGVFRALKLDALRLIQPRNGDYQQRQSPVIERYRTLFLDCVDEMHHPMPVLAVHIGLLTILACINEKTIFSQTAHARETHVDDELLATEMTRLFLRYLGVEMPDD